MDTGHLLSNVQEDDEDGQQMDRQTDNHKQHDPSGNSLSLILTL